MHILLAEDDLKLGRLLQHLLENEQFKTDWITDGGEIVHRAQANEYTVLVLDWMLPHVTGITACRTLRENGYQGAILLLTARDAVDDRVAGLDAGADDYLVKPLKPASYSPASARCRAAVLCRCATKPRSLATCCSTAPPARLHETAASYN